MPANTQAQENEVLKLLRRCTTPELKETAKGYDPEDGSPLPALVMGVPRARVMELARWLLSKPHLGEGPIPLPNTPPPVGPPRSWMTKYVVLGALGLGAVWFLSRRRQSRGSE